MTHGTSSATSFRAKTTSRTSRLALFGVTGLTLVSLLAGCTSAASTDESPSPYATATGSASTSPEPSALDKSVNAVDALKVKGPAEARDIPDMKPVMSGVKPSLPTTVTDAHGKEITVKSADRVLALDLNGTLADTVVGMGLHDRLIGRSNSDTSALLKDLPVITKDGHDTNVEAILNLKPDLIITTENIGGAESYRQLENAGITVVRLEPATSIDGIPDAIRAVGKVFGTEDAAEKLAEQSKKDLAEAKTYVEELKSKTPRAPRATVLYVRGTGGVFFILGNEYGASDIVEALGLEDMARTHNIGGIKPANAESLLNLNPEIVFAMKRGVESAGGLDGFLKRPGMSATVAGKNKRIITAADGQLLSFGPRTPENLKALAEAVYQDGQSKK